MKRKLFCFLGIIAMSTFANCANSQSIDQSYKTALGVKSGDGEGITLKHFINSKNAIEGIYFWDRGARRITGLYETYRPEFGIRI